VANETLQRLFRIVLEHFIQGVLSEHHQIDAIGSGGNLCQGDFCNANLPLKFDHALFAHPRSSLRAARFALRRARRSAAADTDGDNGSGKLGGVLLPVCLR